MPTSKKLGDDESFNELISSLPRETGWFADIYEYEGVWYAAKHLEALISAQKNFDAQDSDIFLVSHPKSGTTWLKAILFTLLNRNQYSVADENHPLLAHNPHDIVHFLERPLDYENKVLNLPSSPSPRLFSTHLPYSFLPECVRNNPTCKMVYVGRNPKDTFVSFWHFSNRLRAQEGGMDTEMGPTSAEVLAPSPIGEMLDKFCKGISPYGPIWDHLLGYWEECKKNPNRIFFLKYEEMSEKPAFLLRRLAEFLDHPFSAEEEEEESGLIDKILKLCSFENLSSLEVNKSGKREFGVQKNNLFFRKGSVGDYKNHLSIEMVEKLDQITEDKFFGSGLNF